MVAVTVAAGSGNYCGFQRCFHCSCACYWGLEDVFISIVHVVEVFKGVFTVVVQIIETFGALL